VVNQIKRVTFNEGMASKPRQSRNDTANGKAIQKESPASVSNAEGRPIP
jgi:hypothetical protein